MGQTKKGGPAFLFLHQVMLQLYDIVSSSGLSWVKSRCLFFICL